jgi:Lrp/AsnC family leucine-responsive transcriptional regulator
MELDELDKRILSQLQKDASLSNVDLAKRVHASAPTCLRRLLALRQAGYIEKQIALLDAQKCGFGLSAVVEITLDHQASEKYLEFEQWVAPEAAVQQCYRVSPGPDFILIIQVADMAAYHTLAHRLFATHANVRNVRSFFSMHRSKFDPSLPL